MIFVKLSISLAAVRKLEVKMKKETKAAISKRIKTIESMTSDEVIMVLKRTALKSRMRYPKPKMK
jgi:hypothetical protein